MAQQRRDELGERTREPTALRLREARRRGQVPRSVDLTSAAAALGAVVALGLIGSTQPSVIEALEQMEETGSGDLKWVASEQLRRLKRPTTS